jgi:hypothetical protein
MGEIKEIRCLSETMHQVEKKLKSEGLFKILQG